MKNKRLTKRFLYSNAPFTEFATDSEIINKLADLEDKIENGELVEQKQGEWRSELVERCDWKGKKQKYYQPNSCSLCHEPVLERKPFCPNCGARMKGE